MTKKPAVARDLSEFDGMKKRMDEGLDVDIKGPDGEPLGFSIRVAGPDSDRQRQASDDLVNERLNSEQSGPMSAAELTANRIRGLAKSVISWTEFKRGGVVVPCTEGNAVMLFEAYPFIREQVEAKAGRRAAFLTPSGTAAESQSSAG